MKLRYYFALLILLFAVACDEETNSPSTTFNYEGTIQTLAGESVVGAEILASKGNSIIARDTSDINGSFILTMPSNQVEAVTVEIKHQLFNVMPFSLKEANKDIQESGKINLIVKTNDSCCGKANFIVRDYDDNSPLKNAKILIKQGQKEYKSIKTNEFGVANFTNLCYDDYSFIIQRDGYITQVNSFIVDDCDSNFVEIKLKKDNVVKDTCCNAKVKFTLKDSTSNLPLANISVKAFSIGTIKANLKSDANGVVEFTDLCAGKYVFAIYFESGGKEFELTLKCNDDLSFTKYNSAKNECCNSKIIIYTKDKSSSTLLDNSRVKLWLNGNVLKEAWSSDGKVVFNDICSGNYGVSISREGYKAIEFSIKVECKDTLEYVKLLEKEASQDSCCNGKIKVILRDSVSGKAISGRTINLQKGSKLIQSGKSNSSGYYIFEKVCEDDYKVIVTLADGTQSMKQIVLNCDETKIIEIGAKYFESESCNTAILKLRIKNLESSTFVDSAYVKIYANGQIYKSTKSNSEGWAIIEGIAAPAQYVVKISKAGFKTQEFTIKYNECKTLQETIDLKKE